MDNAPHPAPPIFEIRNLVKAYGERQILTLTSLDILPGEIFALVGPSGAGKSTLLRLLNFLEPPSEGVVIFQGVSFTASQEMPLALRRKVTTVFQRPMLLDRTVWDNVAFGLRLRGSTDGKEAVRAALETVGLEHLAGQRARTLSGGEAQRVALARAIVIRPDVLLLDEPTANLDPFNVSMIERVARQMNQEMQTTMVLVTHNVFQARRLAHRVAFLLEGQLVEVGRTPAFFDAPQDPRTAAFIRGDMIY